MESNKGKGSSGKGKFKGGEGNERKGKGGFSGKRGFSKKKKTEPLPKFSDEIRLNKYLANTGICSRREADVLIQTGVVSVNGEIITEMGYKVKPGDSVKYDGESIKQDVKRYVLVNKPKGFVTSNNDPWGRKSLFALVDKACKERIVPSDKLGREELGLMLFTNDNDLILKLNHASSTINQLFHVTINKSFDVEHKLLLTTDGLFLDTHKIIFEELNIIENKGGNELGIRIRSANVKVIQKVLEKLGYKVITLDRLEYGPLTKKDLPRGKYRHLTEKEIAFLKMS